MSELLKQVPSRYQLVNVVAARARKIAARAEREGLMLEEKPVSIAVQEIAEGKLDEPVEEVMEEEGVLQGRFAHEHENAPNHVHETHELAHEEVPSEAAPTGDALDADESPAEEVPAAPESHEGPEE